MNPYIGEIRTFAFGQIPRGWAACSGQTLPVNQNQALFSLLGVTYGGNGTTTFNLPNLNGATMLGQGNGFTMGQKAGTEQVTLIQGQIPPHNHNINVVDAIASKALAVNTPEYLSQVCAFVTNQQSTLYAVNGYTNSLGTAVVLNPNSVGSTGGNTPHDNRGPYLTMSVCIALTGIFPSRS